jgi:tungstate transport system permease protein
MQSLWHEIEQSWPLIKEVHGPVQPVVWNTLRLAVGSTVAALIIGLPIALALALGRFRGQRLLQALANASLGLPSVVVGVVVLEVLQWPLNSWRWEFTMKAVYLAQTLLAIPYVVALVPAAIQGLGPELPAQARLLGAGRVQLAALVLREAKTGVLAAIIAALGSGLSEVGAVTIVGGCQGNSTFTTATLGCQIIPAVKFGAADGIPGAIGCGEVLLGLVLVLTAVLTVAQQRYRVGGRSRRSRRRGRSAGPTGPSLAMAGQEG